MRITDIDFKYDQGWSVFSGRVFKAATPDRPFDIWVRFNRHVTAPETLGDPFAAAGLVPAMYLGENLEVDAPMSESLAVSAGAVQQVLIGWYREHLRRIEIRAPRLVADKPGDQDRGSASFFSGGVDSWYTLVKNRGAIDGLITVKGFDVPLEDQAIWPEMLAANASIAASHGALLFVAETNLRVGLDPNWPELGKPFQGNFWGPMLHGAFLAAVGLCLQRHFNKILIASTFAYGELHPWGSHPSLDPLWSTGFTRFEHDGCEANRIAKIEKIVSESPNALDHLRVCIADNSRYYNCGECEKCLRTMLALRVCGCLEKSAAFSKPLDLKAVARRRLETGREVWYREILPLAEANGDHEMARAIRVMLGDARSLDREWHLLKARVKEIGAWTWRKSGIPRHGRSVRKRLDRLRGRRM